MLPIIRGKGGIIATIIADSTTSWGKRLTTFEIEYPRFIHAEFMTHRLLSRNCASSRAIPSKRVLQLVEQSPAVPIHWGKNQAGMQAYSEHDRLATYNDQYYFPTELWQMAKGSAIAFASTLASAGYHKQITNRLVEPFQMIKAIVTATEYDNFYWLRNHHASQPEIKELAACMLQASNQSKPVVRTRLSGPITENDATGCEDEYHLPYVSSKERRQHPLDDCIKLAVARCAAVSYRNEDYQLEKSIQIYNRLVGEDRKHSSALEHVARVMIVPTASSIQSAENGVSHIDRDYNLWSGNFKGWIQYRKLVPDECCWHYKN